MLPVLMSHDFAGSSIKPLIHFAQEWQSGKFRQYDYGREKNMLIYNSPEPPDYDVTKITVPIYLFYSKNDLLINPVVSNENNRQFNDGNIYRMLYFMIQSIF